MMEYLELKLRSTEDPNDEEYANLITTVLKLRGQDVPFPNSDDLISTIKTPENFGTLLKIYRITTGLTQVALALKTPCDQSLISKFERRERTNPSEKMVRSLSQALNITSPQKRLLLASAGYFLELQKEIGS